LPIDLSENVEVTTEELYEVLAGASAGRTVAPSRASSIMGVSSHPHL